MRYSEFITEAEITTPIPVADSQGFQDLARLLNEKCGDYLAIFKKTNKVLYRGTDRGLAQAFSGRSRDERKPKDSNPAAHRLVNIALTKLGIAARRDNSLFTTSDQNMAAEFGVIYIIIPENSAVYSWSAEPDLTLAPSTVRMHSTSRDWKLLRRATMQAGQIGEVARTAGSQGSQRENKTGYDVLKYDVGSANHLLSIAHGMYMDGKDFWVKLMSDPITAKPHLDWVVENWPDTVLGAYIAREMYRSLTLPVEIDPLKLQATYKFTDTHLETALANSNEVLIHGEYIAVRPGVWNALAEQGLI